MRPDRAGASYDVAQGDGKSFFRKKSLFHYFFAMDAPRIKVAGIMNKPVRTGEYKALYFEEATQLIGAV